MNSSAGSSSSDQSFCWGLCHNLQHQAHGALCVPHRSSKGSRWKNGGVEERVAHGRRAGVGALRERILQVQRERMDSIVVFILCSGRASFPPVGRLLGWPLKDAKGRHGRAHKLYRGKWHDGHPACWRHPQQATRPCRIQRQAGRKGSAEVQAPRRAQHWAG